MLAKYGYRWALHVCRVRGGADDTLDTTFVPERESGIFGSMTKAKVLHDDAEEGSKIAHLA